MDIGEVEKFIVHIWQTAIAISPREIVKKKGNKQGETMELSVPTVLNLEVVLNSYIWDDTLSISRTDVVYYISVFHAVYVNNFIG